MNIKHKNTFERWLPNFPTFLNDMLAWRPDYIVPVAKKGCKLLRACSRMPGIRLDQEKVKYLRYFQLRDVDLAGKRIAVVDDATQFTSTLQEYRRFFENRQANVNTYSFVGHDSLYKGTHERYDERAIIGKYLPGPVYQEYVLQQSHWLLANGDHFDLDHLVFEARLPASSFLDFCRTLRGNGLLLFIDDPCAHGGMRRFSLNDPFFNVSIPYFRDPSISYGPINKIKFSYLESQSKLFFSPMVFPTWRSREVRDPGSLIVDFPASLPFNIPKTLDLRDSNSLERVYCNIQLCATATLAKAFTDFASTELPSVRGCSLRRNDLDALLGEDAASRFVDSVAQFIKAPPLSCPTIYGPRYIQPRERRRSRFHTFGDVVDACKQAYESKVKRRKTRLGVHYHLPYERLFKQYSDPIELSESLDRFCDSGVVVAESVNNGGVFTRACRSGEPNGDTAFKRTQVLIPLAIDQVCRELSLQSMEVEPMLLNKVLANFVFDYPPQVNQDLHCFTGVPNDFGSLVHISHPNRAPSRPSIYAADRISPHYIWDRAKKRFCMKPAEGFVRQVQELFDDRQEVPYAEIVSYFRFLAQIYTRYKHVDTLNILSICREQNYFYSHVLFNVRSGHSAMAGYIDSARKALAHEVGKHADSARVKLHGARGIGSMMRDIDAAYGESLEYMTPLRTLKTNYVAYGSEFSATIDSLYEATECQKLFANCALASATGSAKYWNEVIRLNRAIKPLRGVSWFPESLSELTSNHARVLKLLSEVYGGAAAIMDGLPREEPLLSSRVIGDAKKRARNIATHYAYKNGLQSLSLLYLDFSGLRSLPEPKEDVIGQYYQLVEEARMTRNGVKLYGGRGGDDAFTILFKEPNTAAQCAKDIKQSFSENLFMVSSRGDIKFGLGFRRLPDKEKETGIIECWGDAKDCCEWKQDDFRNRGHLLMSDVSRQALQECGHEDCVSLFEELSGVMSGSGSKVYFAKGVLPLGRSRIMG